MNNQTQYVSVDILKVHPQNTEFFDDISGQDYEDFKKSIQEDGIISDIIVAPDMTIVSGHQRYKAAKELGIKMVPVQIREDLIDDDKKLKVLLAANFGRKKNSEAKKRKIAAEYVKLCGYKNGEMGRGRDKKVDPAGPPNEKMTLSEIAKQLDTSPTNLKRMLRIDKNLTEEMKNLLDDGVISVRFAADTVARLSPEDQEQLISSLPVTEKLTQRKVQEEIDKIKSNSPAPEVREVQVVPEDYETLKKDNVKLQKDNEKLKNTTNEVVNLREEVENYKKDYHTMKRINDEQNTKITELKSEIETLKKPTDNYSDQNYIERLKRDARLFYYKANEYIKEFGGYAYLSDDVNIIPIEERQRFITAVQNIKAMALKIEENIQRNYKEN